MALDSSIIMGGQMPKFEGPLDLATRAMTMKNLSQQGQLQSLQLAQAQKEATDQQAIRDAYGKNVVMGPDGSPTLNRIGVMSDLTKSNPMQAMQIGKQFRQDDVDQLSKHAEAASKLIAQVPLGDGVDPQMKQAAWDQLRQNGLKIGIPNTENLPAQYPGDSVVMSMRNQTLSVKDQFDQMNKQRDYDLKNRHENTYEKDVAVKRDQVSSNKQNQTLQQVQQMVETSRGSPAAAQAEKDLYAADKMKSLMKLYPNPNDMPMAQVHLLASEAGKLASGGSPTLEELKGITPNAIPARLSSAISNLTNSPSGANAGAFLNEINRYADTLKGDAQKVINDKYGRVIESRKAQLGDQNYQTLKSNYVDRFKTQAPVKEYNGVTYKQIGDEWVPQK